MSKFSQGDRVVIGGLKNAKHYNGLEGTVTSVDASKEGTLRVCVCPDTMKNKTLRLLEKNLRLILTREAGPTLVRMSDSRDIDFVQRHGMTPKRAYETWHLADRWTLEQFLRLVYEGAASFMPQASEGFARIETLCAVSFQLAIGCNIPAGIYNFDRGTYGESKTPDMLPDYSEFTPDSNGPAARVHVTEEGVPDTPFTGIPHRDFEAFLEQNTGVEKFDLQHMYRIFLLMYLGNKCSTCTETMLVCLDMIRSQNIGLYVDDAMIPSDFKAERVVLSVLPKNKQSVVAVHFEDGYMETYPRDTPHQHILPNGLQDTGASRNAFEPTLTKPFDHEIILITAASGKQFTVDMTPQFVDPRDTCYLLPVNEKKHSSDTFYKNRWPFQVLPGGLENFRYRHADVQVKTVIPSNNHTCRTASLLQHNLLYRLGKSLPHVVLSRDMVRRMIQSRRNKRSSDEQSHVSGAPATPRKSHRVKPNSPCPCGSGKKFKKCCKKK